MHSWYQLGSVYSYQCKNQTEFMQKLKEIAQETGFRPAVRDELIKFVFVTHNTDQKVREYLLDKADPENTCQDFLNFAKTVESLVKTENMFRELLAGAGKVPVGVIAKQKRFQSKSKSKERSDTPYKRGGLPTDSVKSVVRIIHQENDQHTGKDATNAKAWVTLQECVEPKILARGHTS